jgi:signal peptidase I
MIGWVVGLAAAAMAAAVVAIRAHVVVVMVRGLSMSPTLQPGDRLVVRRRRQPTAGAIVVVDEPRPCRPGQRPGAQWVVKRVAAVAGDPVPACVRAQVPLVPSGQLVLLGDNLEHSWDSRHFGFASTDRVLGVAIRRLAMPNKAPRSRNLPGNARRKALSGGVLPGKFRDADPVDATMAEESTRRRQAWSPWDS